MIEEEEGYIGKGRGIGKQRFMISTALKCRWMKLNFGS